MKSPSELQQMRRATPTGACDITTSVTPSRRLYASRKTPLTNLPQQSFVIVSVNFLRISQRSRLCVMVAYAMCLAGPVHRMLERRRCRSGAPSRSHKAGRRRPERYLDNLTSDAAPSLHTAFAVEAR